MSLRLSGGRKLQSPPGDSARPTPSRVRLAVMNMLSADLANARWLDLCCGSGVMGCEALQRGVCEVLGVDQDRRMATIARANLTLVAASQPAPVAVSVVQQEVLRWLKTAEPNAFDLIYADPPYASGMYAPLAEAIAARGWLKTDGRLLLECSSTSIPALPAPWQVLQERRYGSSTVLIAAQG